MNDTAVKRAKQPAKGIRNCTVCGTWFQPTRYRYRKCLKCSQNFKAALVELAKQRSADGVIKYQLFTHLHALRSDDAEVTAWLEEMRGEAKR